MRPRSRLAWIALAFWTAIAVPYSAGAGEGYELVFSTYMGGSQWEHARDVCTDEEGNVYMVGGTASPDFPTTPEAYDRTFAAGGSQTGKAGDCDAFVAKFSPDGKLIWSTLLGGPNYDRAYAVEVGPQGNLYIAGRAGPGFPVTEGAFQTQYGGSRYNEFYGSQNGFVACLAPDGRRLIWSSFVGVGELCRDIAIDESGDVYLPLGWNVESHRVEEPAWFAAAFATAFQKEPRGDNDCGVVKVRSDGSSVVWGTWLGGSARDSQEASIRVGADKQPVIFFNTQSRDLPATGGGAARGFAGETDGFVAKFSTDGARLIYGTYLGGTGTDWALGTHNLALDAQGSAYATLVTASADFPTTAGAAYRRHAGETDFAIVKLSATGKIVHSTLIGGEGSEEPDGVYVDASGDVVVAGVSSSADFPTTDNALQREAGGRNDAVVLRLSADFQKLAYATRLGGASDDVGRSLCLGPDGSIFVTGAANGAGWPTEAAYQPQFGGTGDSRWGNGDCILARLRPR